MVCEPGENREEGGKRGGGVTYDLMSKPSNTSSKKCILFILFGLWNNNMHVLSGIGRNSKK